MKKKVIINTELHEKLGMTILSEKPNRSKNQKQIEFQKDKTFLPKGVTLEDAQRAMKKCKE
jgi:hypothetical protein